jgi:topoisomerase-4 subunit A
MPDDLILLPQDGEVPTNFSAALSERYLAYAMSTITARSLPDVRDGLKPVHRRLLWAMHQLRLDPSGGFKKCARIVGDVMGKYHPHGDASIYEAMVRLAQEFAARYTLVEGQGNFGNIDGDNAAAMRYTEARLTAVAQALLEGIEDNAVDFRATYDGEEQEPIVLPAAFPNLLANGAAGIAVGMATSIPPHNAGELCAAAIELIRNPKAEIDDLLRHVPGPDFPTGGILVESAEAVREAYATGRGGFRIRARWEKEALKNGTWQVVVSEIPYQVQKSRLIEQIAQLMEEKKLPLLADVRDESTDIVRIVLEPRNRTVEPAILMETLFRATALENRISLNMNVLDASRTPLVMGLKQVLRAWLDHRHEVLVRRSQHRLDAIARRLEILEGYLIVYLNLDEVIRIVREEDQPKQALIATFKLTDTQAEAILNMRLRALRKLEEMEIRKEHKKLSTEQKSIQGLLASETKRWNKIADEIAATREKFGEATEVGRRRTTLDTAPVAVVIDERAFVEKEPITVILSEKGWIRALKGHVPPENEQKFKEGDKLKFFLHAQTTDRLCLFATNGKCFTLKADALPRGRGDGQPVRLMVDLTNEDDVVTLFVWQEGVKHLVASTDGRGFVVKSEDLLAEKRTGKQVLVVDAGKEAACLIPADGDTVAIIGENRNLLVFPLEQLPEMTRGRGVALQGYRDGGMADVKVIQGSAGLSWKVGERVRLETDLTTWRGNRAGAGRRPPHGFPKNGRFGD